MEKKYDPQVLRFFMLSAHYRRVLNFTETSMEAAKASLGRIRTAVRTLNDRMENAVSQELTAEERARLGRDENGKPVPFEVKHDPETGAEILPDDMRLFRWQFEQAMDDDLNPADAEITDLSDILGLIVDVQDEDLDAEIERKIEERQAARKAKDFAKADAIRDELLAEGIVLKDTRDGVRWERK